MNQTLKLPLMKTRLLLFMFLAFNYANAQVTFSENFDAAGIPTGWTYNGFSKTTSLPCSGTSSVTATYDASPSNYEHSIHTPNYVSNGDNISFSFDYKLFRTNPDFGIQAFIDVYYAINNGSFNLIQTFSTNTTTCTNYSVLLPSSYFPAGANVKFAVGVRRSTGYFTASLDNFVAISTTPTVPEILSISATGITSNSAVINYSLDANDQATTSVVKYGFSAASLTNQTIGFSATGNTLVNGTANLIGLSPNTVYFYTIEATNSFGTATSTVRNFTTSSVPEIIAEYRFDNSLMNVSNNSTFSAPGVTNPLYTTNRFGIANSALVTSSSSLYRDDITNLPVFNQSRTISLWIRPLSVNADNIIFTYGVASGNNVYGASFNASNIYNFTYSSNLAFANATTANNWKHIVYTYEQSTGVAKIYVDGVLGNQGTYTSWNTGNNINFFLGNSFGSTTGAFNGAIDDLKIYNYALNATEVSSLYTNNTLTSENFNLNNLEVKLYPNPVRDILNIEIENDIQSIEIYNIQGQKVLSSNQKQINVSDLATGMYMVRIQDIDDNIATKKIVIK